MTAEARRASELENQLLAAEVSLTGTAPTAVCDERHRMPSQRVDYSTRWQAGQLEVVVQFIIPYRTLGRTGERGSAIGLGGWHLGLERVDEQLSVRIIRTAIDRGINFLDNCWDYNDGASETRMGKALRDGYREKVFLMTKIDGRSYAAAMGQLEMSLERLQTDCIDLVQHHEILRYDDPHRIFDDEGANRALVDGQKAGKIRYIGFTGHKDPRIHLYMLDVAREHDFLFDTVQMPLNVMDAHYRSFGTLVLPELVKQGIGVLGMKPMANGIILTSKTVSPMECLSVLHQLSKDRQVILFTQEDDVLSWAEQNFVGANARVERLQ